jgi:DNA anti-recombination protein RmuC
VDQLKKLGKTLGSLSNHYDELIGPRLRAVEKPMEKIEDLELKRPDQDQIENDAA